MIEMLPSSVDRLTARALHCDRHPLPDAWLEALDAETERGSYALTHAALAGEWALENGCLSAAAIRPVRRQQVELLEQLASQRAELAAKRSASDDLWLEALAMLHYVGEPDRVPNVWIDAVLDAQQVDGGWAPHPVGMASHPHPTALALWVLLEYLHPNAPPAPMIPPR